MCIQDYDGHCDPAFNDTQGPRDHLAETFAGTVHAEWSFPWSNAVDILGTYHHAGTLHLEVLVAYCRSDLYED